MPRPQDFAEKSPPASVPLGTREWFADDAVSAADIQMRFPVEASAQCAGPDASRPRLMGFLRRTHAHPAYRQALERGGPYSFATD